MNAPFHHANPQIHLHIHLPVSIASCLLPFCPTSSWCWSWSVCITSSPPRLHRNDTTKTAKLKHHDRLWPSRRLLPASDSCVACSALLWHLAGPFEIIALSFFVFELRDPDKKERTRLSHTLSRDANTNTNSLATKPNQTDKLRKKSQTATTTTINLD